MRCNRVHLRNRLIKNSLNLLIYFQACRPAADWGPYLKEFRGDRYAHQKEPEEAIALHGESGNNEVPMTGKENPVYQSTGEEELTKI